VRCESAKQEAPHFFPVHFGPILSASEHSLVGLQGLPCLPGKDLDPHRVLAKLCCISELPASRK
jgi:hypothetical protein